MDGTTAASPFRETSGTGDKRDLDDVDGTDSAAAVSAGRARMDVKDMDDGDDGDVKDMDIGDLFDGAAGLVPKLTSWACRASYLRLAVKRVRGPLFARGHSYRGCMHSAGWTPSLTQTKHTCHFGHCSLPLHWCPAFGNN